MSPSLGRRLADARAKAMGRQALRFQLEVTPYGAANLAEDVKAASFAWERGAKLQFTAPAARGADGGVRWTENLKQVSTLYKDGNRFAPKEYIFKVQSVDREHSHKPVTVGKCRVNLAQYCSCGPADSQDLHLSLKPQGILNVRIRALWLPNSRPDQDTMTDISCLSLGNTQSLASSIEQDLGGFNSPPESPTKSRGPVSPRTQLGLIPESDEHFQASPAAHTHAALAPAQLEAVMQLQASSSDVEDDISPMSSAVNSPRSPAAASGPPSAGHFPSGLTIHPSSSDGKEQDSRSGASSPQHSPHPFPSSAVTPGNAQLAGAMLPLQGSPQVQEKAQPSDAFQDSARQPEPTAEPRRTSETDALDAAVSRVVAQEGPAMAPAVQELQDRRAESGSSTPTSEGHNPVHRSRWRIPARQPSKERLTRIEPQNEPPLLMPAGIKPDEKVLWARLDNLSRAKDVEGLARYCKELLTKRQIDTMTRSQTEQQLHRLQQENSGLGEARERAVQQLQTAEQQLARSQSADIIAELVNAKITAADKDFIALDLQGRLYKEQAKVRLLLNRLTNLEAEYYSLKNRAFGMPNLWLGNRLSSLKVETKTE